MSQVRTAKNPPGLRDIPFELPRATAPQKKRALELYKALEKAYPDAHCELEYKKPHELVIATILSAQATDVSVNKATPALFKAFPKPADYAKADPGDLHPYIRTIGLFRNKAKSIVSAMQTVTEEFGGKIPDTMDDLLKLKGVARKTANVVLGNAFDKNEGVVVDTHVDRIAKRMKLAPEDATIPMVERHLMAKFPREKWCMLSHLLIFHGRRACKARGGECATNPICQKFGTCSREAAKATSKKRVAKKTTKKRTAKKTTRKNATKKRTTKKK